MKELETYDSDVERNFKKSFSEFLEYLALIKILKKFYCKLSS